MIEQYQWVIEPRCLRGSIGYCQCTHTRMLTHFNTHMHTHNDMYPYSYFLYSVSHPDKHSAPMLDLSKDSEAQIANSDTFSSRNLAVERVITKVFTK